MSRTFASPLPPARCEVWHPGGMQSVDIRSRDPHRFAEVIGAERSDALAVTAATEALAYLAGKRVVNINSTASGGGVAEMLKVLLGYVRGAGIDATWLVMEGQPAFFDITKRLHNHLYGGAGDGGPLGEEEHEIYRSTLGPEMTALEAHVRPGDIVIIHDPQPAGLAETAKHLGAKVVWRCHVGIDEQNDNSRRGWEFLRRYLEPHVDHYIFTDRRFPPDWVPTDRLSIIWPSIDPFAPKNQEMSEATVEAILTHAGIIDGKEGDTSYTRDDGSPARVDRACDVVRAGPPASPTSAMIVQVSRWDVMKDMAGVMQAFAHHIIDGRNVELVLAGPPVAGVADDPEGQAIYEDCARQWRELPYTLRRHIQLVCVPMDDIDENAAIVNALQRHATIVTQKSFAEGFGLTVAEAMLKGTPVVATAVGGIVDQVIDGETGRLIHDPNDLEGFARTITEIVDDDDLRRRLGEGARRRAVETHLGDTHLALWLDVIRKLIAQAP
jgi:trehalose synthase